MGRSLAKWGLLSLLAAVTLLLAGCPPKFGWGPPIVPPRPLLPPLNPDPLAAAGPGSVHVTLDYSVPVLAYGAASDLASPNYGTPQFDAPLGLYPANANRPTRQQFFTISGAVAGSRSRGEYSFAADFMDVPLGDYNARVAWWIYSYAEDYSEFVRGPQFTLTAAQPTAVQHLDYARLRGTGAVSGRLLFSLAHPSPADDTYGPRLSVTYLKIPGQVSDSLDFNISPYASANNGRVFFELRDVSDGQYWIRYPGFGEDGPAVVALAGGPADKQLRLVGPNYPDYQLAPRQSGDNMFFGYLQLTGARTWTGDLRLAARPAGSSPDSLPTAWLWLDGINGGLQDLDDGPPWYAYYQQYHVHWPPPGIAYGLAPLAQGNYDIYAELYSPRSNEHISLKLATAKLPPDDPAALFIDEHGDGPPYWAAQALTLDLTVEQAQQFD